MCWSRFFPLTIIGVYLVTNAPLHGAGQTATPESQQAPGVAAKNRRKRDLMLALRSNTYFLRSSIQELSVWTRDDSDVRKLFITLLSDPKHSFFLENDLIFGLANGGEKVVPELTNALNGHDIKLSAKVAIVICLGRLGKQASSAVPVLKNLLDDPSLNTELRCVTQTALANIQFPVSSDLTEVREEIGRGSQAGISAIRAICLMRGCHLVDPQMAKALFECIDKKVLNNESVAFATIASGNCMGKPDELQKRCEALLAVAEPGKQYSSYRIIIGITLFRIDPQANTQFLERTVAYCGTEDTYGRTDIAASYVTLTLGNENGPLLTYLTTMLDSKDVRVKIGAAKILTAMGREAKDAAPKMLEDLKHNENERIRREMALALGEILDDTAVSELNTVLASEKSDLVKLSLDSSIRMIQLRPVP